MLSLWNVWRSAEHGSWLADGDNPWGHGNLLGWTTSCPPSRHNFLTIPESAPCARPSVSTTRTVAP